MEEGSENFSLISETYYICTEHSADVAYHNLLIATFWFLFVTMSYFTMCVYILIM